MQATTELFIPIPGLNEDNADMLTRQCLVDLLFHGGLDQGVSEIDNGMRAEVSYGAERANALGAGQESNSRAAVTAEQRGDVGKPNAKVPKECTLIGFKLCDGRCHGGRARGQYWAKRCSVGDGGWCLVGCENHNAD